MNLTIKPSVLQKIIQKHNVTEEEVFECFYNRTHEFLTDEREEHKTSPITQWFMSETDTGRDLKVCFVKIGTELSLKTCFPSENESTKLMYYKKAMKL
jgi:hypothetical protein